MTWRTPRSARDELPRQSLRTVAALVQYRWSASVSMTRRFAVFGVVTGQMRAAPDQGSPARGPARGPIESCENHGRDWTAVLSTVRRAPVEVQLDAVGQAPALSVLQCEMKSPWTA
jgi:hypothetical protein